MTQDTIRLILDAIGVLVIPVIVMFSGYVLRKARRDGVMDTEIAHLKDRLTKGEARFTSIDDKLDRLHEKLDRFIIETRKG